MIEVQVHISGLGVGAGHLLVKRSTAEAEDPLDAAATLLAEAVGYAADWLDEGAPELGSGTPPTKNVAHDGWPYG